MNDGAESLAIGDLREEKNSVSLLEKHYVLRKIE